MLLFPMDEANFTDGHCDGIRVETGAGLKADFDEVATDAATLGLWHLHDGTCRGEGTGLEDASGGEHDLTNHGATPVEGGYRLVRADGNYLDALVGGEPERSHITIECWVRDWGLPTDTTGCLAHYFRDADNHLLLAARRAPDPQLSHIAVSLYVGGTKVGGAAWFGTDLDAMLAGSQPWHAAVVLDAPNRLDLFVNGTLRAQDTLGILALPSGDYTLRLGRYMTGWTGYDLSAVLDEVRLSSTGRYTQTFTPHRLLALGTYSSPTFDGVRLGARWMDLVRVQSAPPGCDVGWHVRAADETDMSGDPQALWQAYFGDPGELPNGRFLQWRATLTASEDRATSPTVESVEARASEAGYNLYHATGDGPESLDYDDPWAQVGPDLHEAATAALDPGTTHWFGIRPADVAGRESPTAQTEIRLELDGQGNRVLERPAGVLNLSAQAAPEGKAQLRWRYRAGSGGALPSVFRVFGDGGTGTIDYETPLGETPHRSGQLWYAWTTDPLTEGVEHQLAVRAETSGGLQDEQPAVVHVTPDATAPAEVDFLRAEMVL